MTLGKIPNKIIIGSFRGDEISEFLRKTNEKLRSVKHEEKKLELKTAQTEKSVGSMPKGDTDMTIEAKVPLNDVKTALGCYQRLYNCVHNPIYVYDYKTQIAKKTFLSLVFSIIKILIFTVLVAVAATVESDWKFILVLLAIIFAVSILLDLFYWQKVSDKRLGRPRFRYSYYISCFINDIRELSWFKRYFGISTPSFLMIFGVGRYEAHESIKNWGYLVGDDYVKFINAYDDRYKNYRDYVDLGRHWGLCGELLNIINSGRAVDIQGALAVVDTRKHRKKMESYARDQAEAAQRAADAAWATANAAAATADATESIARSEQERNEYLRQIRDKIRES